MQAYLLSAAGVIFLSVIVSLIIPEGKLNKTITFVMRLICIVVLIQPITGIFGVSPSSEAAMVDYGYVQKEYSRHQSRQLEILLAGEFGADTECNVIIVYDDGQFRVEGVEVAVITSDINLIDKIQEYIRELGYINISVYAKST